jgi:hypothetical protein
LRPWGGGKTPQGKGSQRLRLRKRQKNLKKAQVRRQIIRDQK